MHNPGETRRGNARLCPMNTSALHFQPSSPAAGSTPGGGLPSRNDQLDRPVAVRCADETISGQGFDHRPILPKECRGRLNVGRLYLDAAGLSSALVGYLKMERIGY